MGQLLLTNFDAAKSNLGQCFTKKSIGRFFRGNMRNQWIKNSICLNEFYNFLMFRRGQKRLGNNDQLFGKQ